MARPRRDAAATIARRISEDVRALNYATLPADSYPGLDGPVDVHNTIGALMEAAGRLPQALDQLAAFLVTQAGQPGLADDFSRYKGDPDRAIRESSKALRQPRHLVGLRTDLDFAFNATSGLYVRDAGPTR